MEILEISNDFLFAGARTLGLFLAVPFFSSRLLPFRFRLALAALFVIALPATLRGTAAGGAATAAGAAAASFSDPRGALLCLLGEALLGLALGWSGLLVLGAIRGAAALIADQIGLSLGGAVSVAGEDGPALRSFHAALGIFIFLALDLHHAFLRSLAESFTWLPPGSLTGDGAASALGMLALSAGSHLFEAALVIAFPVMSVLLLVSVAQGALSRVLGELDFFAFGITLRAAVGLCVVFWTLPRLAGVSQGLLSGALESGREMLSRLAR